MTKSAGHCKNGDGKASILTQLQQANKQTPAENYAEFAEEVNGETNRKSCVTAQDVRHRLMMLC